MSRTRRRTVPFPTIREGSLTTNETLRDSAGFDRSGDLPDLRLHPLGRVSLDRPDLSRTPSFRERFGGALFPARLEGAGSLFLKRLSWCRRASCRNGTSLRAGGCCFGKIPRPAGTDFFPVSMAGGPLPRFEPRLSFESPLFVPR